MNISLPPPFPTEAPTDSDLQESSWQLNSYVFACDKEGGRSHAAIMPVVLLRCIHSMTPILWVRLRLQRLLHRIQRNAGLDRGAQVGEHRLQGGDAEQDILRPAGVAHQADAPHLAGQGA